MWFLRFDPDYSWEKSNVNSLNSVKIALVVGAASLCCLAGCRSTPDSLTYANFSRINQNASTESEVAAILGEPTNRLGRQWLYERPKQHLFVFVDFDESGRVSRKQWVDATSGTWDDTKSDPAHSIDSKTSHSHNDPH